MFDNEDPDYEPMDETPFAQGEASGQETPFQNADEGQADKSLSPTPDDAAQLNAPDETITDRDEAFKSETVVKDYKSWQRINQEVAEFTGRSVDEIKALPFEERMSLLATERKSLTDKLESLRDFESFVGIKVDAPADRWQVGEQLNALPENHRNKLVDAVMTSHLSRFIEQAAGDPSAHPKEFQLLDQAYTQQLERAAGRPWEEVRDIVALTAGISPQQLYQVLQGQGGGQSGHQSQYAPSVAQQTSPQGLSAVLLADANSARVHAQELVNAGWENDSPEVQAWLRQEQTFRYSATQAAQQERAYQATNQRVAEIEGKITKSSETDAQKAAKQIDSQYDTQATAARNGALDAVVKGRVTDDAMTDVRELIDARADRLIAANPKAQTALDLAKDFEKDGLTVKAKGQMAIYAAIVSRAYQEAGSFVLTKFVVPQAKTLTAADKQKAARKEIGLTGNGRSNATIPNPLNGRTGLRDEDVGNAALEYYHAQQS